MVFMVEDQQAGDERDGSEDQVQDDSNSTVSGPEINESMASKDDSSEQTSSLLRLVQTLDKLKFSRRN